MALIAVALRLEGHASGTMAGSARSHVHLGGLVNVGFEIQGRFRVLLKERIVTGLAVCLFAHYVSSVIESYISVFRHEDQLRWRTLFFLLSEHAKGT